MLTVTLSLSTRLTDWDATGPSFIFGQGQWSPYTQIWHTSMGDRAGLSSTPVGLDTTWNWKKKKKSHKSASLPKDSGGDFFKTGQATGLSCRSCLCGSGQKLNTTSHHRTSSMVIVRISPSAHRAIPKCSSWLWASRVQTTTVWCGKL